MKDVGQRTAEVAALKQSAPYIRMFKGKTFVVKAGGGALAGDAAARALAEQVDILHQVGIGIVLVHGGGPQSTALARALGDEPRFVAGRRVTDERALGVATMVLNGAVNTRLLAACRAVGLRAVGLSGVDAGLIEARRRGPVVVERGGGAGAGRGAGGAGAPGAGVGSAGGSCAHAAGGAGAGGGAGGAGAGGAGAGGEGIEGVGAERVGAEGAGAERAGAERVGAEGADGYVTVDYGHVGDIAAVDPGVLLTLLGAGMVPVVSPLSADRSGALLNVNADTVAAALAVALGAEKLILMTGAPGILERAGEPGSLVSLIDRGGLARLRRQGALDGGMLPKASSIEAALAGGVRRVHVIGSEVPDSLLAEVFTNEGVGTMVVDDLGALPAAEQLGEAGPGGEVPGAAGSDGGERGAAGTEREVGAEAGR